MTESAAMTPVNASAIPAERLNTSARLTACDFLRLLGRGEITVAEYATACADVVDELEASVHAWVHFDRMAFLAKAAEMDAAIANGDGELTSNRLFGVPIGVKDIFNTADMPTQHGSKLFEGYQPGNDARVVTNVRRDGALIAGKTVTAEFAVHASQGTRNPYDFDRASGTSSSGSAVAVATGMVPMALASQTAGSTIRPASYCGIYGFKPSFGLIPRTAMLKTTDTLDTVAFMARSVEDLSLMFEIQRVRGPNYPIVDREMNDRSRYAIDNRAWRVGLLNGPKSHLESPRVKEGMKRVAQRLGDAGCRVEGAQLPPSFTNAYEIHETIYRKALSYYFRTEWRHDRSQFSEALTHMIEGGETISTEEYLSATAAQTVLANAFDQWMSDYDILLTPSAADDAPLETVGTDVADHSLLFTMCYAPSISVPVLSGTAGLPVGVQIASRRFNDYLLLQFADLLSHAYDRAETV